MASSSSHLIKLISLLIIPFFLGCSTISPKKGAPVVHLSKKKVSLTAHEHTVQPRETLHEIATLYGKNYHTLAALNGLHKPYIIYPGQKLKLKEVTSRFPTKPRALIKPRTVLTNSPKKAIQEIILGKKNWVWPVKGKVIKEFKERGPQANKGIDIAGVLGTPIQACQSGKVVYAGMGLRGYGQLIIIKHNSVYLSAYAHNSRLLVREGEQVRQGQVISQMGKSEVNQVSLHFEIRKHGSPVDPLTLLPPH